MKFNKDDILVFEGQDGNIYEDLVGRIQNRKFEHKNNNKDYLEIYTNRYIVSINYDNKIFEFYIDDGDYGCYIENVELKEIWTKVDEDTYKKVWKK